MEQTLNFIRTYFDWFYIPRITITDVIEIVIIAFLLYHIMMWFQSTRAWTLIKGILVLLIFMALATVFQFNTLIWIFKNTISVGVIAVIIIFQPEFRRALEQLGRKKFVSSIFSSEEDKSSRRLNKKMLNEIAKAVYAMSEVKTGALIVLEQEVSLGDYERTGIAIDSKISSQLLINIFEHNTPLHDGAVIVRGDRVVSATCYLPLSDNMGLSKELGTRHRAGVGISEVTDSLTVIVSEETGYVSVAYEGELYRNLNSEELGEKLKLVQNKPIEDKKRRLWKGRSKNEKEIDS